MYELHKSNIRLVCDAPDASMGDNTCDMTGMDMRGGRGGPPGSMGGPGRGGPMGKAGGNMEGDRWGKRALPPPPPGSGGGAIAGLPALHKTDNKFKVRLDHVVKVFSHWIREAGVSQFSPFVFLTFGFVRFDRLQCRDCGEF